MIPDYTHNLTEYLTALPDALDPHDVLDVLKVITTDLAQLYCHEWATFVQTAHLVTAKTKLPRKDIEKTLKQFLAQHASTNGHAPPRSDLPDTVEPEQIDEFLTTHCTGTLSREERDIRFQLLIPALAVLQAMNPVALDGHVQQIAATLKFGIRAIKEELSNYVEERQYADDPRKELRITTNLKKMLDAVEQDLLTLPGPIFFQRARMVVRIALAPISKPTDTLQRPPESPIIVRVPPTAMHELSGQVTRFMKLEKRAHAWVETLPPAFLFEHLLVRTQWQFPQLTGILGAPTLRSDGSILSTPGYDPRTGLYLDFGGMTFPPISAFPTEEEMLAARDKFGEPFAEFPFKQPHHRSAALAAGLTLLVRLTIAGCIPLFAARAYKARSGKGLLLNTIAEIGTGRIAPTWTHTLDPAEEGKRLLSIALAGDACIHIDNISQPFGSDKLDSALTTQTVNDRLLGTNSNAEVPWLTVLFASGNNLRFKGDMVHRVIPIDLDPKEERPEERIFTRPDLLTWVHAERPRFVVAGLTLLKAFFNAGCPKDPKIPEFGGFTQWANLIRHGLVWAGLPDPCGGRITLAEESDVGHEALTSLLDAWERCYAYNPTEKGRTLRVILGDIDHLKIKEPTPVEPPNAWNDLHDALSSYDAKYDGKRLDARRIGNELKRIEGQQVGLFRLMRKGTYQGHTLWKREPIE